MVSKLGLSVSANSILATDKKLLNREMIWRLSLTLRNFRIYFVVFFMVYLQKRYQASL